MATTQWSRVLEARDGSDTQARRALEDLCQTYWGPLYAFVRRQGAGVEDASDLTQAYFAELLEKEVLRGIDPSKGRFRSFLLASLKNFLSRQRRHEQAQKRGGAIRLISLDAEGPEQWYRLSDPEATPDEVFEQRWAMTVLNRSVERLQFAEQRAGRGEQFEVLKLYLTSDGREKPYREVAESLGMTEGALKKAVSRLRGRLGRHLQEAVAETVTDETQIEDEVRHLISRVRS